MNLTKKLCVVLFFLLLTAPALYAQKSLLKNFKESVSPLTVGNKVSKRFVETPHTNFGFPTPPSSITYSEVCAWYGALKFAKHANDTALLSKLEARFLPLLGDKSRLVPKPDHVDHTVFGAIPLELYMQTGKDDYRAFGKTFADKQWEVPASNKAEHRALLDRGLTWQTRMWIDDMFMITMAQAQAYRATGDQKYIDRAAKEMVVYLDELQRPNGLFYHAPDVPFFWGRGNGWMAAGMTELLSSLPKNNPNRKKILKGYRTMMASLLKYQDKDGMWLQLLDDPASWKESSCTGMFTYAMITGVKEGWLNAKTYGPAARKGWLALINYIDANGDVREVCEGTNKKNDKQHYLNRKRITGDMHGQAPVLWCTYALLK